jgi:hypothetical protein
VGGVPRSRVSDRSAAPGPVPDHCRRA